MAWDNEKERIGTSLPKELLIQLRHLAVEKRCRFNKLLEEAIRDLLKKYEKEVNK